jgi:hypothetical protein
MAAAQGSAQLTAAHAITVVKQLPPTELRKFKRQFAAWREQKQADEEETLLARIKENSRLPRNNDASTTYDASARPKR